MGFKPKVTHSKATPSKNPYFNKVDPPKLFCSPYLFWRGRICLLKNIGGNSSSILSAAKLPSESFEQNDSFEFELNAFKLKLFLASLPLLVFLAIWHFCTKVS